MTTDLTDKQREDLIDKYRARVKYHDNRPGHILIPQSNSEAMYVLELLEKDHAIRKQVERNT